MTDLRGHNADGASVAFTLKLFNSLANRIERGYLGTTMELPAGSTVLDLLRHLGLSTREVSLVIVNGGDISRGCVGDPVRTNYAIQRGDTVALSGPVPYSWGYGSPVV